MLVLDLLLLLDLLICMLMIILEGHDPEGVPKPQPVWMK